MISDKIKEIRKAANLSQEQFAEVLGVSRQAVTRWETGRGTPDLDNLKMLSKQFQVSIDDILENDWKEEKQIIVTDRFAPYVGKVCDLELVDWNNNLYEIMIDGQDEHFIYYHTLDKCVGAVAKSYISEIKIKSKKYNIIEMKTITLDYFVGKIITLYLEEKYFWSGLIGDTTVFTEVKLLEVNKEIFIIEYIDGRKFEILVGEIVKIEDFLQV